jgi:hypothetical protein
MVALENTMFGLAEKWEAFGIRQSNAHQGVGKYSLIN